MRALAWMHLCSIPRVAEDMPLILRSTNACVSMDQYNEQGSV